jgi:hypothetical protein
MKQFYILMLMIVLGACSNSADVNQKTDLDRTDNDDTAPRTSIDTLQRGVVNPADTNNNK